MRVFGKVVGLLVWTGTGSAWVVKGERSAAAAVREQQQDFSSSGGKEHGISVLNEKLLEPAKAGAASLKSEPEKQQEPSNGASSPSSSSSSSTRKTTKPPTTRKLTGKFLHITDVHPDPYYKTHSSTDDDAACHRDKGPAGYFGAETSDCDSPLSLVNATFSWLRENLRDEVDFVIWTGDSARHDNDESLPRSAKQVVSQNEFLVSAFLHAFGKTENEDDDPLNDFAIPIVPTLGNNDVLPHNIFAAGPNEWTTRYLDTWRQFIPEPQRHQFHRGGWFSVEVIPGKLVVFSLNTLYFFASNSAVDGCVGKSEPGYEQFEWLRVQLEEVRRKGMRAMLMGHVPPARTEAKTSWEESCWQKYALWMHHFRDVLVGGLYGHMNIDHFMVQDFAGVKGHVKRGVEYDEDDDDPESDDRARAARVNQIDEDGDGQVSVQSAQDYLVSLRDVFSKIPKVSAKQRQRNEFGRESKGPDGYRKIGGEFGERYSLTLVAPSVVPNYFPTIRVFSYNISGLEELDFPGPGAGASTFGASAGVEEVDASIGKLELRSVDTDVEEEVEEDGGGPDDDVGRSQRRARKKKPHKFRLPTEPAKTAPPGPAYSPQALTLLSFTQYYANLTRINNDFVGDDDSPPAHDNASPSSSSEEEDTYPAEGSPSFLRRWKPGKHHGKPPPSNPKPGTFEFEVEYDTASDKIYKLEDLTVNALLDLARRIAGTEAGKSAVRDWEDGEGNSDDRDVDELGESGDEEGEDKDGDGLGDMGKKHKHKKKGKKKKKNKKKKKHEKTAKDKEWYAFLQRAFVGAIDMDDDLALGLL